MRRFYRFLTNIWFREINVVDDENLPPEGGILYITWHPSGLIDPMLMMATLPGRLTTIAKHTLFKIPVLGRMLKASGCVPIERPQDSKDADASRARNATMLDNISQTLASGGRASFFQKVLAIRIPPFGGFARAQHACCWALTEKRQNGVCPNRIWSRSAFITLNRKRSGNEQPSWLNAPWRSHPCRHWLTMSKSRTALTEHG